MKKLFLILNLVVNINLLCMAPMGLLELPGHEQVANVDVEFFSSLDVLKQVQKAKTKAETIKIPKTVASKFQMLADQMLEYSKDNPLVVIAEDKDAFNNLLVIAEASNVGAISAAVNKLGVPDLAAVLELANYLNFENLDLIVSAMASNLTQIDCKELLGLPYLVQDLVVKNWAESNRAKLVEMGKQVLEGHTNWVNSVAMSQDSKRIVSAGRDSKVIVWDLQEDGSWGKYLLKGHTDFVSSVALSKDSKKIVAAGSDGKVIVWDLQEGTGYVKHLLEGHTGCVSSVAISEDGNRIVSAGSDCKVIVWNLEEGTGYVKHLLEGHASIVNSVAISEDSKRVVSAGVDGKVIVWDLEEGTGYVKQMLEGHTDWIRSVVLSKDSKRIVSAGDDHKVIVWNLQEGGGYVKWELEGHTDWVYSVAISQDRKMIVSAGNYCKVRVWNLEEDTGYVKHLLEGHTSSVYSVALSQDSKRIVSAGNDNKVIVWDLLTEEDLTLPIICAISKEGFSEDEKKLLLAKIDFENIPHALKHLKNKLVESLNEKTILNSKSSCKY
jgi:WD40 repeat protein